MSLFASALALSACAVPVGDAEGVDGEGVEAYAAELARYPQFPLFTPNNHEVNVCFLPGAAADAKRGFRFAVESTWGAVAQIWFTGWNDCPTTPAAATVPVRIVESADHECHGFPGRGSRFPDGEQISMHVLPDRAFFQADAVHEMGHVLGMAHEQQRTDSIRSCAITMWTDSCATNNDCPLDGKGNRISCDRNAPFSGDYAKPGRCIPGDSITETNLVKLTPYDPQSVMNYCRTDNSVTLTAWDVFGIQQLYGRRSNAILPLYTQWSASREDHATGAWALPSDIAIENGDAGYQLAYHEGYIFNYQAPSTVPLDTYYSAARGDYVLVANSTTRTDVVNAGYQLGVREGYAYSSAQPGTTPLVLYWHQRRGDHFTALAGSAQETAAINAGYVRVRVEAHVFASGMPPYNVTWHYWNSSRGDNLITTAGSWTAIQAESAGYVRAGLDMMTLKYNVPGTVALRQLFSSTRGDYFATTSTASFSGYVAQTGNEGFVFSSAMTSTKPVQLWWHSGRADNFTTVEKASSAQSAGYGQASHQGHIWALAGALQ